MLPFIVGEVLYRHEKGVHEVGLGPRRRGGLSVRVRFVSEDAGADHTPLRLTRPARRADAPDAGLRARHDPPDRISVVPDALAPLHVPAVWRLRLPLQPRLRR